MAHRSTVQTDGEIRAFLKASEIGSGELEAFLGEWGDTLMAERGEIDRKSFLRHDGALLHADLFFFDDEAPSGWEGIYFGDDCDLAIKLTGKGYVLGVVHYERACDSCEVLSINGVATHERGCPNSWIDPATGDPYTRECEFCGYEFTPEDEGQTCCDEDCSRAYSGAW